MTSDSTDPFSSQLDESFYFISPALNQRINLLQHLIQFGDMMLLLCGEKGAGKTTLMNRVIEDGLDSWQINVQEGDVELTQAHLLGRIARDFDLSAKFDEDIPIELGQHFDALQRRGQSGLLIVDDAHTLPQETLALLLDLDSEYQGKGLRLVLIGENSIIERVESLRESSGIAHIIDIPRLDEKEVERFLIARLKQTGFEEAIKHIDPAILSGINNSSRGLPGQINRAAEGVFIDLPLDVDDEAVAERVEKITAIPGGMKSIVATVCALLLGGLAYFYFSGNEQSTNESPVVREIELPTLEKSSMPKVKPSYAPKQKIDTQGVKVTALKVPLKTQQPSPEKVAKPLPGLPVVVPISKPEPINKPTAIPPVKKIAKPDVLPAIKEKVVKPAEKIINQDLKEKPEKPKIVKSKTVEEKKPIIKPTKKSSVTGVSGLPERSVGWIQKQVPGFYTVQYFGSHDLNAIKVYLKRNQLKSPAWFKTSHKGKAWYVLISGVYISREAAHKAIAALPSSLKKQGPWTRTFQSIQEAAE